MLIIRYLIINMIIKYADGASLAVPESTDVLLTIARTSECIVASLTIGTFLGGYTLKNRNN